MTDLVKSHNKSLLRLFGMVIFTTCCFFNISSALADTSLPVGIFSQIPVDQTIPQGWEPLIFKKIDRHTRYDLISDAGETIVRAQSDNSASGLIRRRRIDPKKFPIIQWRWKIDNVYEKGDVNKKSGDDYPARIYIAFEYDPKRVGLWEKAKFGTVKALYGEYPPIAAINYIWASKAPPGTRVPNPYVDRVKMVVVESGAAKVGQWITEERNIYQDYLNMFGEEPPVISGVAIMTDSDNTGEAGAAYYGDILFKAPVNATQK
jgi:hypothetical protein